MFEIDNFTIVQGAVTVAMAAVTPFVNVMTRRVRPDDSTDAEQDGEADFPGISVVLTVDDDAEGLKQTLPSLLAQDYPGELQVVVVLAAKDSGAEETLNAYATDKRVYTTFIPSSSRYVSRRKLAVTMGVKAARHEWIMLTDTACMPHSDRWLRGMASMCGNGTGIVMGLTGIGGETTTARRFDHAYTLYRQMADAERGNAWAYCGNNLMFRKSLFLDGKGFDGNLKYIRGEYEFIVNKFAPTTEIAVNLAKDAGVTRHIRSPKEWRNAYLSYMAVRKELASSRMPRFRVNLTMTLMALAYAIDVAGIAFGAACQRWVELAVAAVALIATFILRGVVLRRSAGAMAGILSPLKLAWLELTMPARNLCRLMRYRGTDKYEFICHKI